MYKAIITYDGTRYFGWQKTAYGPSIQEELEKAIFRITQEKVLPEAASRTDRGVHAFGQVIQFSLITPIDTAPLLRALNAVLPQDIRIKDLCLHNFHPTLDAIGKEYIYKICLGPVQDPTLRLYSWHVYQSIDLLKVERAAQDLIGTHDFSAFANEIEKSPLCTILSVQWQKDHFSIRGNRFLYKMVRNIVGTLIDVGTAKLPEESIPHILASRSRKEGGVTAPAHGLYLHQVFYPIN
jgi:tRNA pseudouridine38-40 synthase